MAVALAATSAFRLQAHPRQAPPSQLPSRWLPRYKPIATPGGRATLRKRTVQAEGGLGDKQQPAVDPQRHEDSEQQRPAHEQQQHHHQQQPVAAAAAAAPAPPAAGKSARVFRLIVTLVVVTTTAVANRVLYKASRASSQNCQQPRRVGRCVYALQGWGWVCGCVGRGGGGGYPHAASAPPSLWICVFGAAASFAAL